MIVEALDGLARGELHPRQPEAGITYAKKLSRDEARLDWRLPAERLERQVRAFDPWPGAYFLVNFPGGDERIRVLAAEIAGRRRTAPPGTVLDERLSVACGEACCGRPGCSAPAAARWTATRCCAALRSRPERCCRAPLQTDDRI
jgi:methionyl-tRNA formyltransferase